MLDQTYQPGYISNFDAVFTKLDFTKGLSKDSDFSGFSKGIGSSQGLDSLVFHQVDSDFIGFSKGMDLHKVWTSSGFHWKKSDSLVFQKAWDLHKVWILLTNLDNTRIYDAGFAAPGFYKGIGSG